ncbi:MAG: methylenetetrahydrofolate reductase [NAD(P)H] [Verrucomicrobiae bacterium]|nr:methylenetetrahydrofolate reductase [NAD(P)H] [Verrucomicrobiae bacterium]
MLVRDILTGPRTAFSFEFFPPKTAEGWEMLFGAIAELAPLKPSAVSVTYGAGGSTRDRTHDLVLRIRKETDLTVVSHLTCVGSARDEIRGILERYAGHDVNNILALRGDPPKGLERWEPGADGFRHAAELVGFIRRNFPHMGVGVAGFPEGHPEMPNRLKEMDFLKAKVDAGADYIVTQLFFDNRDFFDFCERCDLAGIRVPIVAGILPVMSRQNMIRMAELAAGARIPARLLKMVMRAEGDEDVERIGTHWATEQVSQLIDAGVKGVHFYTLNRSKATLRIYRTLGLSEDAGKR